MSEYYYILNHFERLIPDFEKSKYENATKDELIAIGRSYFKEHSVDATAWYSVNEPDEKLIYGKGCHDQIYFVRNVICGSLFFEKEYPNVKAFTDEWDNALVENEPKVISTHCSKSVILPVMEIDLKSVGVKIFLRNNFHDWCISIESEKDINCDFKGLVTDRKGYFEGLTGKVYCKYSENNKKKFSVVLNNDYEVFTFMWLLRDSLYSDNTH